MDEAEPATVKNAAIGAEVTFVVTFIPLLGFLSPVFGGGVPPHSPYTDTPIRHPNPNPGVPSDEWDL